MNKTARLDLRIQIELKQELIKQAKKKGVKFTDYVREGLIEKAGLKYIPAQLKKNE